MTCHVSSRTLNATITYLTITIQSPTPLHQFSHRLKTQLFLSSLLSVSMLLYIIYSVRHIRNGQSRQQTDPVSRRVHAAVQTVQRGWPQHAEYFWSRCWTPNHGRSLQSPSNASSFSSSASTASRSWTCDPRYFHAVADCTQTPSR